MKPRLFPSLPELPPPASSKDMSDGFIVVLFTQHFQAALQFVGGGFAVEPRKEVFSLLVV